MIAVDALGPNGEYRTRAREVITDIAGTPVAELSIAPPLFVSRSIRAQRSTRPLPAVRRKAALAEAAQIFAGAEIAGYGFDQYIEVVSRCRGCPSQLRGTAPAESLRPFGMHSRRSHPPGL